MFSYEDAPGGTVPFSFWKERRDLMKSDVTIMDFTGIYEKERFYRGVHVHWIDCRDIQGTNCYCNEEGEQALRRKIAPYSAEAIHFIDSGNYHYMTKLWTEKLREPFVLAVADHHPDMQPPLFQELLSCGCWVNGVLDGNPYVQKVVLLGADKELVAAVPEPYRSRMVAYEENQIAEGDRWESCFPKDLPVYLSIDKDILSPSQVHTNWQQGTLTFSQLQNVILELFRRCRVLGADICGECADALFHAADDKVILQDDSVNGRLLHILMALGKAGKA